MGNVHDHVRADPDVVFLSGVELALPATLLFFCGSQKLIPLERPFPDNLLASYTADILAMIERKIPS